MNIEERARRTVGQEHKDDDRDYVDNNDVVKLPYSNARLPSSSTFFVVSVRSVIPMSITPFHIFDILPPVHSWHVGWNTDASLV